MVQQLYAEHKETIGVLYFMGRIVNGCKSWEGICKKEQIWKALCNVGMKKWTE